MLALMASDSIIAVVLFTELVIAGIRTRLKKKSSGYAKLCILTMKSSNGPTLTIDGDHSLFHPFLDQVRSNQHHAQLILCTDALT